MQKDIYILGISCYYHDAAAALVKNGEILAAVQEERFTRKKHDPDFPINAIKYCLDFAGITPDDINVIAFYDKPWLKFERLLQTYLAYVPKGFTSFKMAIPKWAKQSFSMWNTFKKKLGYTGKVLFTDHHESHAASAFFPSPFKKAAFLTVDGVGEWTTTSYGYAENNRLYKIGEIHFPHSLGLLYSAFTYYTGFKVNSGEYKLMGLAPYGEPEYVDIIKEKLIDIKEDGSFKLNMEYFNYCAGLTMTGEKFHKLFGGPPRKPESKLTQKEMDLARSIQIVTEEILLKLARHVHKQTNQDYLCLAGGVALNCVANSKILREGPFKKLWIQPAAGDAGGALGVALFTWYSYFNNGRDADDENDFQKGSYLGPEFTNEQIEETLKNMDILYEKIDEDKIIELVPELINAQCVVGWHQGRMEFGPRALGARSILGDARSSETQRKMNLKIKFRESFRPFAPSVLYERTKDFFEFEHESPYMLFTAPVKNLKDFTQEEKNLKGLDKLKIVRSDIPAVTHVNNTGRLQTVHKHTNPLYYKMIENFDKKYGCAAIVNTSFNVRGEPIVCTPEDAVNCFMGTGMDWLVIGNFIVEKKKQKNIKDWEKYIDKFALD